jgi:hypothetical protein
MAEIGRVQTTRTPWPTTAHTVKPTGEQQRQPDKQHKQKDDEREQRDDDDGLNHIDEYA